MPKKFNDDSYKERYELLRRKEEDALIETLATEYGYQYIDLHGVTINPDALHLIEEATARQANLVAFELKSKLLSIAIRNPNNRDTQNIIKQLGAHYQLTVFMTSVSSLEHAWDRYKDMKQTEAETKGVFDITDSEFQILAKKLRSIELVDEYVHTLRTANNARRTSETLATIFAGALSLGASDIHIEPEETDVRMRYRLDGVLHDVTEIEPLTHRRLMSRLKLLAGVKLNIRNEAQDGRFTFDVGEKAIEVRASIIPGASGESIVMRLLDPTVATFKMKNLGLNERIEKVVLEELHRPNGMIITTGPTGSGKTTALYAFMQEVHTPEVKIITIEDPVEYKLDDIVQTQVGEDYTFAAGLRAILRQDPDIIMVGEIRDREVAQTAINASQTGHLVFSTLHTNSAAAAFARLIDLGVDYRTMGNAINLVLGQRLVRVLCEHCKKERPATDAEFDILEQLLESHPDHFTVTKPFLIHDAVGCELCGDTGFKGRASIFEGVRVDTAVEDAIMSDPREHVVQKAAQHQGIPTMQQDGADKVRRGITSFAELTRVIDVSKGIISDSDAAATSEDTDFLSHIV